MLTLNIFDFRKICDEFEKRIYYYQVERVVYLYFISEGMIVRAIVDLSTIDNVENFFTDKIFNGAMKLEFNLPEPNDENSIRNEKNTILDIIGETRTDEGENVDLQREGVHMEP